MTSVTLQLDNTELCSSSSSPTESDSSEPISEQITKLFPKCRPRSDINLNPEITADNATLPHNLQEVVNSISMMDVQRETDRSAECSALGPEGSDEGASSSEELGDDLGPEEHGGGRDQVIILTTNKGGTYKLRDSRIIEIAGGREVFSQSRTKAARKSRYINSSDDCDRKKKSPSRPGVWEVRTRSSDHKNSRNTSDNNDSVFNSEVHSVLRHQRQSEAPSAGPESPSTPRTINIINNSPPIIGTINNKTTTNSESQSSPPRSLAVVADGEVVVFDDIGDNWQGLRLDLDNDTANNCHSPENIEGNSTGASSTGSPAYHNNILDYSKTDIEIDTHSPENKVARVIGSLPIAEYEGSPRRYRPRQTDMTQTNPVLPSAHSLLASPSLYPPRPGFPQRVTVSMDDSENELDTIAGGNTDISPGGNSTFDYLYEFSETRKVLEEFFKCPTRDEDKTLEELSDFNDLDYELHRQAGSGNSYVGSRLAKAPSSQEDLAINESPRKSNHSAMQDEYEHGNNFLELSVGTGSSEDFGDTEVGLQVGNSRNFTLSPETTDCDSNCGDLDSEVSLMLMENEFGASVGLLGSAGDLGTVPDSTRLYSSMPVLEDGLSSGHASDTDNNNPTALLMKRQINEIEREIIQRSQIVNEKKTENGVKDLTKDINNVDIYGKSKDNSFDGADPELEALDPLNVAQATPPPPAPAPHRRVSLEPPTEVEAALKDIRATLQRTKALPAKSPGAVESPEITASPIWVPRQRGTSGGSGDSECPEKGMSGDEAGDEEEADTDLETDRLLGQQRTDDQGFYDDKGWRKPKSRTVMPTSGPKISTPKSQKISLTPTRPTPSTLAVAPMLSPGKGSDDPCEVPDSPQVSPGNQSDGSPDKTPSPSSQKGSTGSAKSKKDKDGKKKGRNKEGTMHDPAVLIEGVLFRARYLGSTQLVCEGQPTKSTRMMQAEEAVSRIKEASVGNQTASYGHKYEPCLVDSQESCDESTGLDPTDSECEHSPCHEPLGQSMCTSAVGIMAPVSNIPLNVGSPIHMQPHALMGGQCGLGPSLGGHTTNLTGNMMPMGVGSTGTVFRLQFLGSVEVEEEGGRKRRKRLKKNMVEEAVTKIKAPEGENQPSTEVDLFISTEKIMVLNTDLKEIMMDHALRTISYIADIGDLVVLMARRRFVPHEMDDPPKMNRTPKMICHVFESEEAQFIAQSIGQAFQVAYMEFLKANGIEDHSFVKEMDYQEVLNSQEIFGDELQMFAKKEMQKEVVVPKAKGEILGVVIVESGWGSMLPTVVIANLAPAGAAARCGQLNIGDQIIAINGVSLVGLPLSTCQNYIKNSKNQTVVKLTVVPCAPVVEVKIKRPDTKYQLGFSVQNGVICSLLRGGIAERGGVRVGHRIIEINNQSVVAVPHEKIVNLLATSVGEILMKTMPTSMFRLLTGQENPVYI